MGKPGYVADDAMMIFNKMLTQCQMGVTPDEKLKNHLKAVLLEPFGVSQSSAQNNVHFSTRFEKVCNVLFAAVV